MKIDWHRIWTPVAWIQVGKTDWEYDKLLNDILDNVKTLEVDTLTVTINGIEFWTSNYPYSYGNVWEGPHKSTTKLLPSVKTRKRLYKLLKKEPKLDDMLLQKLRQAANL